MTETKLWAPPGMSERSERIVSTGFGEAPAEPLTGALPAGIDRSGHRTPMGRQ